MKPLYKALDESQVSSGNTPMTVRERIKLAWYFQRYLIPFWDKVLLSIVMGIIGSYSGLLFPLLNAKFIDVVVPQKDVALFLTLVLLLGVFGFFFQPGLMNVITGLTQNVCDWYVNLTLGYRIRLMFYKHLHSLSMRFFQKRPIGEHMFRAQADAGFSIALITHPIPQIIKLLGGQMGVVFIAIHLLPWYIIVFQYTYMLLLWWASHWVTSVNRRMSHVSWQKIQAVDAGVQDGLAGFMTIKAFGRQRTEIRNFMNLLGSQIRWDLRVFWFQFLTMHITGNRLFGLKWFHANIFNITTSIMIILGAMKLGEQGAIGMYLGFLTNPFQGFFDLFQWFRTAMVPAERLRDTLSVRPAVEAPKRGVRLKPLRGHIVFENVSFAYENETVIQDLSFEIQPGTTVGIVGPSGAGKSTLLSLILRLYDPTQGRVLVDGHDVKTLNLIDYHHQIGPVLQETFLFQGSLLDNMLFAKPTATNGEIEDALRRAEILDFVKQLPDGLDTDLSEGSRVSGGQKQRIGIARAILRDPGMLIFDEPTSALDIPTENAIVKTLESVIDSRTSFFVSHRLGLVSGCDTILVLDQGKLAAQGSHAELLKNCELYRGLWNEQYGEPTPEARESREVI